MVSLHPSVRLSRWQRDKVLSFVPPDGTFTLCSYSLPLPSVAPIPLQIRPNLSIHKDRGKLEVSLQPPRSLAAPVENVVLVATLPASADEVKVETSVGKAVWDVLGKRLHWSIGRLSREGLDKGGIPVLRATFAVSRYVKSSGFHALEIAKEDLNHVSKLITSDDPTASNTTAHSVHAEFRMQGWCPSGIRIDSLQVLNENGYKPYKVRAGCSNIVSLACV